MTLTNRKGETSKMSAKQTAGNIGVVAIQGIGNADQSTTMFNHQMIGNQIGSEEEISD